LKIKRYSIALLLIAITAVTLYACNTAPKQSSKTVRGTVTKVHDGDSIHITPPGSKRVIIRLAGIDAPELEQPHGKESRDYLRQLILRQQATASCNKVDKYRRQVCSVTKDNTDINHQLIEAGLAWHYKQYQNYAKSERKARKSKTGLWRDKRAQAPWDYRAANR